MGFLRYPLPTTETKVRPVLSKRTGRIFFALARYACIKAKLYKKRHATAQGDGVLL